MQQGSVYTLPVGGKDESGIGDAFLRRRTGAEVCKSRLSCGCGDNAVAFLQAIEGRDVEALLVDSAEVSSASLVTGFSGHVVVALRPKDHKTQDGWCLVDTTNLRLISRNWSEKQKRFDAFGHVFWIGYCGPLQAYPVHSPEELKRFYAATLAGIPHEVLETVLVRLDFKVDPSLLNPDGSLAIPRLRQFIELQKNILKERNLEPRQTVTISLKRGGNDSNADLQHSDNEGWISQVGLKSGCSPSLLDYYETGIARDLRKKQTTPTSMSVTPIRG